MPHRGDEPLRGTRNRPPVPEIVGAPWIDGGALAKELDALALPGVRARAVTFQPTFPKHAGKMCGGVQVHVTEGRTFRPFATYLALVAAAYRQAPDRFVFRTEMYEFRDDVPALDLLTGAADARQPDPWRATPRRTSPRRREARRVDDADRAIVREARELARPRFI